MSPGCKPTRSAGEPSTEKIKRVVYFEKEKKNSSIYVLYLTYSVYNDSKSNIRRYVHFRP